MSAHTLLTGAEIRSYAALDDAALAALPEISRHNALQVTPQEHACGCITVQRVTDRKRGAEPFEMRLAVDCGAADCDRFWPSEAAWYGWIWCPTCRRSAGYNDVRTWQEIITEARPRRCHWQGCNGTVEPMPRMDEVRAAIAAVRVLRYDAPIKMWSAGHVRACQILAELTGEPWSPNYASDTHDRVAGRIKS